jgi:hypothetical protein
MVERMALDQVAREAARIVHATVTAVRSDRDASGLPATWITLDVARTLKGTASDTLTIKQYGVLQPLADGTIARIGGLPRYAVGEEVVLFLRGNSRLGFTSPVGLGQGVYRVRRVAGRPMVRNDSQGHGSRGLDEFLSEVARVVADAP